MSKLFKRAAPFIFVLLALVLWWVLSQGAASVIKTYEARFAHPEIEPSRIRDVVIPILTLLAAIWASARAVFPPEDFTAPTPSRARDTGR